MADGHYFEIGETIHSSNWNSTSSGFHALAASVAFQKVQRIVVTRGMTLAFRYTVFCRMFWFLHKFKKLICPIIIFRLESTIDGEI
jgi:hypothetical protein